MTKKELIEAIKDCPDDAEIDTDSGGSLITFYYDEGYSDEQSDERDRSEVEMIYIG